MVILSYTSSLRQCLKGKYQEGPDTQNDFLTNQDKILKSITNLSDTKNKFIQNRITRVGQTAQWGRRLQLKPGDLRRDELHKVVCKLHMHTSCSHTHRIVTVNKTATRNFVFKSPITVLKHECFKSKILYLASILNV